MLEFRRELVLPILSASLKWTTESPGEPVRVVTTSVMAPERGSTLRLRYLIESDVYRLRLSLGANLFPRALHVDSRGCAHRDVGETMKQREADAPKGEAGQEKKKLLAHEPDSGGGVGLSACAATTTRAGVIPSVIL